MTTLSAAINAAARVIGGAATTMPAVEAYEFVNYTKPGNLQPQDITGGPQVINTNKARCPMQTCVVPTLVAAITLVVIILNFLFCKTQFLWVGVCCCLQRPQERTDKQTEKRSAKDHSLRTEWAQYSSRPPPSQSPQHEAPVLQQVHEAPVPISQMTNELEYKERNGNPPPFSVAAMNPTNPAASIEGVPDLAAEAAIVQAELQQIEQQLALNQQTQAQPVSVLQPQALFQQQSQLQGPSVVTYGQPNYAITLREDAETQELRSEVAELEARVQAAAQSQPVAMSGLNQWMMAG